MASGKSFLGKELAKRLQMDFIDLDDQIESLAGKSIQDIFQSDGEEVFRRIETAALKSSFDWSNIVIATGGGTPCFAENMQSMNDQGITIFLDCSANVIADRLAKSQHIRPLIENVPQDQLVTFVEDHLGKRMPFYTQAQYSISISNDSEENLDNLCTLIDELQK
jgi:shikimate kinase